MAAMNELRFPELHIRPQRIKRACRCGHRTSVSNPGGILESRCGSRRLQIYSVVQIFKRGGLVNLRGLIPRHMTSTLHKFKNRLLNRWLLRILQRKLWAP